MDVRSAEVLGTGFRALASISSVNAGFILVSCVWSLICLIRWSTRKNLSLPPGPPRWPIIGSLPYVGTTLHEGLKKLSDKHGDIMYLKFGLHPFVVVSSVDAAEELFKYHDATFANRPRRGPFDTATKYAGSDGQDLALSPYNEHFKTVKKLCMTEIFSPAKLLLSQHIRRESIKDVIQAICANSAEGQVSDTRQLFRHQQLASLCKLLFGKQVMSFTSCGDGEWVSALQKFDSSAETLVTLFGKFNIADMMCPAWLQPAIHWLDPQGLIRQWKKAQFAMHSILKEIIEEHKEIQKVSETTGIGFQNDFLHTLLLEGKGQLNDAQTVALCSDLVGAGIDTSASLLQWSFIYLLRNPECMSKLQAEIDSTVGMDRVMEEKDIPDMPYLQAIVKETLRLRPPVPSLMPRSNYTPQKLGGYDIPADCVLIVNYYAIAQNPCVWKNPEEFMPERFLGCGGDFHYIGNNYKYMPFGSGRRGCIGSNLAFSNVCCTVASICHALDVALPPHISPKEVSTEEFSAFVCSPRKALQLTSKCRPPYRYYASN